MIERDLILIVNADGEAEEAELADDDDAIYEARREALLESLEAMGIDDDLDELPVDLNPEGDPTRNGAF